MKTETITLQLLTDVKTCTSGILKAGEIMHFNLFATGSNWYGVVLPSGARKTLFHFEAKRIEGSAR